MFYRQFTLLAIAILLLSPNPVRAEEIEPDSYISVGNIYIQNTNDWMIIHTPQIQIVTPKSTPRSVERDRQRRRNSVSGRRRTFTPSVTRKKIDSDSQTTVTTNTYSSSGSIIRRSTIRSSGSNGSQSTVSDQRQSIQCSGEGSYSVSQSTSTVNGRTVSSRNWTSCD
ncbi:hypothetical protein [Chamaesiphon minutus]|uniref:Secreted protein n=1 Tax=Chamaesiphon minutus (strain ATCC 27169 / PCC 6605) TaxID=1173020 RepID=K9UN01_CHAP6|nr:hypothetical protein [Chamaesiphon minutus]AFY95786.1 hypothetical protein Cha6605_4874 [Chamaesiphon minutus PCC 6605]